MTLTHPPTIDAPVGVDASWQVPHQLRPAARDLPALAWLGARHFTGRPDGPAVDPVRAAGVLPVFMAMLAVQHATGTLAARGRDAFVILTPRWSAARRPYRAGKTAWLAGGTYLAVLLLVTLAVVVDKAISRLGTALGVGTRTVADAELGGAWLILAVWGVALVTHPLIWGLAREGWRWGRTRRTAPPAADRTVLATSLCGRGRSAVAAVRLGRDVLQLADVRGWALLTNGGVRGDTGRQYARLGFGWLPDRTRRMWRPAAGRGHVDVAVQFTAHLAGQVGVRIDEVRLVDAAGAWSTRSRGRAIVALPVQYLDSGELAGYARAAVAHEIGHHALGHFTRHGRWGRVGRTVAALAVLVAAAAVAVAVTDRLAVQVLVAVATVAGAFGVLWLGGRPVRRQEYQVDAFAVQLVGVDDVLAQLRRLRARELAAGRWSRRFGRLFAITHPPVGRRLERVLHDVSPAGSPR